MGWIGFGAENLPHEDLYLQVILPRAAKITHDLEKTAVQPGQATQHNPGTTGLDCILAFEKKYIRFTLCRWV